MLRARCSMNVAQAACTPTWNPAELLRRGAASPEMDVPQPKEAFPNYADAQVLFHRGGHAHQRCSGPET